MPDMPKLQINWWGQWVAISALEQAKHLPFREALVFLGGRRVDSYEKLLQLARKDGIGKDLLEVTIIKAIGGG